MSASPLPSFPPLSLHALGKTFLVEPRPRPVSCVTLVEQGERLLLFGQVESDDFCCRALCTWLQEKAVHVLPPLLRRRAASMRLVVANIAVKGQKSRWGSCSGRKNINLNRNLLFLEPDLVDYIFVHELCHLVHMNHGEDFQRMVASHLPDWLLRKKRLRVAERRIPLWAWTKGSTTLP